MTETTTTKTFFSYEEFGRKVEILYLPTLADLELIERGNLDEIAASIRDDIEHLKDRVSALAWKLKEAQRLCKAHRLSFRAWLAAQGISKTTAYRIIKEDSDPTAKEARNEAQRERDRAAREAEEAKARAEAEAKARAEAEAKARAEAEAKARSQEGVSQDGTQDKYYHGSPEEWAAAIDFEGYGEHFLGPDLPDHIITALNSRVPDCAICGYSCEDTSGTWWFIRAKAPAYIKGQKAIVTCRRCYDALQEASDDY